MAIYTTGGSSRLSLHVGHNVNVVSTAAATSGGIGIAPYLGATQTVTSTVFNDWPMMPVERCAQLLRDARQAGLQEAAQQRGMVQWELDEARATIAALQQRVLDLEADLARQRATPAPPAADKRFPATALRSDQQRVGLITRP